MEANGNPPTFKNINITVPGPGRGPFSNRANPEKLFLGGEEGGETSNQGNN